LSRRAHIDPCQVRQILFIKFAEHGSTVLAYPAICRATEMVGRQNVYFVVFEDNRFILDVMEIIPEQNVITISTKVRSRSLSVPYAQSCAHTRSTSTP
jgi:hypothetical protein